MASSPSILERVRPHGVALLLAVLVPVALVAPIATGTLERFDYPVHRELAWSFQWPAHFLYHLVLTAFRALTGDWMSAQKLLLMFNYGLLGLTLYAFLARGKSIKMHPTMVGLVAASLVFVYAIPALYPLDGQLYFGYVALNVYHNTTILLLKPIVALHLLWLCLWLGGEPRYRERMGFIVLGAVLVILSALAKPSYLVVLLPAVFLVVARDHAAWRSAMLALFLPGVAVLAWLFLSTFGGGGGGLAFAPFKVLHHFTEVWTVFPKVLLSIVFPLVMLVAFRREVASNRLAVLCWLMFLIGCAYGILLAERGERVFDGNWFWSGQIAAFALFAVHLMLLIERHAMVGWNRRTVVAWLAFSCHLAAGLVWYLVQFERQPTQYW